jgi:hypothetical protein
MTTRMLCPSRETMLLGDFRTANDLDRSRRPARLIRTCHLSLCLRMLAIDFSNWDQSGDQMSSRFNEEAFWWTGNPSDIIYLGWWCAQSNTNRSPVAIPS